MVETRQNLKGTPLHWHEFYEAIIYWNCRGTCYINNVAYSIEDGSCFLMTPIDSHETVFESTKDSRQIMINFLPSAIDSQISSYLNFPIKMNGIKEDDNIVKILKDIKNELGIKKEFGTNLRYHLLNTFVIILLREGIKLNSKNKIVPDIVIKAITYISNHYTEGIGLYDVAASINVNPSYLSALFSKTAKITLTSYISELRIENSKYLLKTSNMSILDVCYASGFGTYSHFFRTFKNVVGITPAQYRNLKKEEKSIIQ